MSATVTKSVVLYGTSACHLCDQAEDMVRAWIRAGLSVELDIVDIADSDELFQRYGIRIPVLRRDDGGELGWPFDMETLGQYLENRS